MQPASLSRRAESHARIHAIHAIFVDFFSQTPVELTFVPQSREFHHHFFLDFTFH